MLLKIIDLFAILDRFVRITLIVWGPIVFLLDKPSGFIPYMWTFLLWMIPSFFYIVFVLVFICCLNLKFRLKGFWSALLKLLLFLSPYTFLLFTSSGLFPLVFWLSYIAFIRFEITSYKYFEALILKIDQS